LIVKCSFLGCASELTIKGRLSSTTKYVCKNHPRKEQVEAFGRTYNPEKDHSDEEAAFQSYSFDKALDDDTSFGALRKDIDGSDNFMRGHQIIKSAGATLHNQRMRKVPAWALNDGKIRELVSRYHLRSEATEEEKRHFKGRLVRLIYLYYRVGMTTNAAAEELGMTPKAVERAIERVRKAMTSPKKRGRPRKVAGV
jgi:hypothetical protein